MPKSQLRQLLKTSKRKKRLFCLLKENRLQLSGQRFVIVPQSFRETRPSIGFFTHFTLTTKPRMLLHRVEEKPSEILSSRSLTCGPPNAHAGHVCRSNSREPKKRKDGHHSSSTTLPRHFRRKITDTTAAAADPPAPMAMYREYTARNDGSSTCTGSSEVMLPYIESLSKNLA